MTIPKFSVVLIGRNEEKTLPVRILASLKEFLSRGGDVVYVDTGSSDRSLEVARRLGCRTFEGRFDVKLDAQLVKKINLKFLLGGDKPIVSTSDRIFDFALARNTAHAYAVNDVILVAGCDEYFTRLDIDAMDRFISCGSDRMDICYAHSHDSEGRASISFRRGVVYNRSKYTWVGTVHETIRGPGPVGLPPQDVIYCEHFQEENENRKSYLPGLAYDCYMNPTNDRNLHYFARELFYTGRYHSAIATFQQHIRMEGAWDKEQAQSMLFIGDCWECLGGMEQAKECWMQSFEMDGTRNEPLMRLAMFHYKRGNHQKAAAFASASLPFENEGFYFNQSENYRELPHEILYVSLWWLGKKNLSKAHWSIASALAPNCKKYQDDAVFYQ